jgi:hypothetical protein
LTFVASFLFLSSFIRVGKDGDSPPFFVDEAHKLAESYYWHLFSSLALHDRVWTEDFYARTNPPFPKYVFGISLTIVGNKITTRQLQSDFDNLWQTPHLLRERVNNSALRTTRLTSSLLAALVCTVLFLVGFDIGGLTTGVVSVLLTLLNPIFIYYALLGLHESLLMFLFAASCLVTAKGAKMLSRWLNQDRGGKGTRRYIHLCLTYQLLPATVIGLATGTRVNGTLTAMVYIGGIAFAACRCRASASWARRLGAALLAVLSAGLLAFALFLAINPYYYARPLPKTIDAIRTYRDWTIKQQIEPGGGLYTSRERVAAIGYATLRNPQQFLPLMFGAAGIWLACCGLTCGIVLLGAYAGWSGIVDGCESATRDGAPLTRVRAATILWWALTCMLGTAFWLPLQWQRYLLIPLLGSTVLIAAGLTAFPSFLMNNRQIRIWPIGKRSSAMLLGASSPILILTILLASSSWIIAPELLEPGTLGNLSTVRTERVYLNSLEGSSRSSIVYRNYALALINQGRLGEAEEQLKHALWLLDQEDNDSASKNVQRYRILFDLAGIRMGRRNPAGAAAAISSQIEMILKVSASLTSSDPFVKRAFHQILTERRNVLRQLREAAPQ